MAETSEPKEVKGAIIKAMVQYVQKEHEDRFEEWIERCPEELRRFVTKSKTMRVSGWYPMERTFAEPLQIACDMLARGDLNFAWEAGRFSAHTNLRGVHRAMVRLGSRFFLFKRSPAIMRLSFRPVEVKFVMYDKKKISMKLTRYPINTPACEHRVLGYCHGAFEVNGCTAFKISIDSSMARGDSYTEYVARFYD